MRPTFIACTARSGSTLLRWLIDAHPEISCPAETDAALAVAAHENVARALWGPSATKPVVHARRAMEETIEAYLREHGKKRWCDKSMSNALNLDLLARTWMGAHFIFLHRHVMDFIASALNAQPFGLNDYGFGQHPGDDVSSLARYWLERTDRMLTFERKTGHRTVRIRYEDLVQAPNETMTPIWHLLGVEPPDIDPDEALRAPRDTHGCADHRIWHEDHISTGGLYQGARIPPGRITGMLRREVNEALGELDYATIDDAWGAGGPLVEGEVRLVRRHVVLKRFVIGTPGTIVVDGPGALAMNLGDALRRRDIRYYGAPLSGYGEEHAVMERVWAALKEER